MTSPLASDAAPFGRVLTAMVTPFTADGRLDLDAAQRLATHLVDHGNDGLVVSGTTGESPTTTGEEDARLLAAVVEAVGDRASIVAGVGTNDTRHSVELAQGARKAGAHGLLVVTPYYSKPPQAGIVEHVVQVTRAGEDVPVMLYDIPGRTGVQIAESTYEQLVTDPLVVAVKDAVGDLERGAWLMANTGIRVYSGDDAANLGWLAVGASGFVGVTSHFASAQYAEMVRAVDSGDLATARALNTRLLPAVRAIMTHTQGVIATKAGLELQGLLGNRHVRAPLVQATADEVEVVRAGLAAADLLEVSA
ncbi:MAG: 4-hydroxy-tetrahydrodipicolinate synthase [Aeromicrobium erythreum]